MTPELQSRSGKTRQRQVGLVPSDFVGVVEGSGIICFGMGNRFFSASLKTMLTFYLLSLCITTYLVLGAEP